MFYKILFAAQRMPGEMDKYIFKIGLLYFFGSFKAGGYKVVNELVGRVERYDLTLIHYGDPVAEYFRLVHIVRSDNDSSAF